VEYAHDKITETHNFMQNMSQSELSRTRTTDTIISVCNQSYSLQVYILFNTQHRT